MFSGDALTSSAAERELSILSRNRCSHGYSWSTGCDSAGYIGRHFVEGKRYASRVSAPRVDEDRVGSVLIDGLGIDEVTGRDETRGTESRIIRSLQVNIDIAVVPVIETAVIFKLTR